LSSCWGRPPTCVFRDEQGSEVREKGSNLGVTRICVKHVREKLGCNGYACYNEAVDVTAVYDEFVASRFFRELGHAIEIYEERDEYLVGGWTVFEDAEKVGFEGDGGCRAGMK
jgi:hypothetical protein